MNPKPVVRYIVDGPNRPLLIQVGLPAAITPMAHPSPLVTGDGQTFVQTSRVIRYDPATGAIETQNTLYIPAEAVPL